MVYQPGKILYDTATFQSAKALYDTLIQQINANVSTPDIITKLNSLSLDQHTLLSTVEMVMGWIVFSDRYASVQDRIRDRGMVEIIAQYLASRSDIPS
jgi:hypothetical protein